MILTTVFLALTVLLMGFAVYIIGVISSKMDHIVYYVKMLGLNAQQNDKDDMQKQFMGMMNYTAEDWRDADE